MNAHTPGPWSWWTSNSVKRLSSGDRDGGVLHAYLCRGGQFADISVSCEDARLIAAAPELLAALQGMLDQADSPESYAAMIDRAVTAIAKATGAE